MSDRVCTKCKIPKPLIDGFYASPHAALGRATRCKECTKTAVKANYANTREARSGYERERTQRPERKAAALVYQRTRRAKDPQKSWARGKVSYAVRTGKIARRPCRCGETKVQAHHHDYSKPLDVIWVCFKCHREEEHGQVVTVTEDEHEPMAAE